MYRSLTALLTIAVAACGDLSSDPDLVPGWTDIAPLKGGPRQERTILMDSPVPRNELDDVSIPTLEGIEPEVLRALADLEDARRNGSVTETEYQQRRENLLGQDGF